MEGLRALADDLESYASFQTAAIVRDMVAEVEAEFALPGLAEGGRPDAAFQWLAS